MGIFNRKKKKVVYAKNYGFKMSKLTGNEPVYEVANPNMSLPESFSYKEYLPSVLNQGSQPICVPCALEAHIDWNYNVDTDGKVKRTNNIKLMDIFNIRKDKNSLDGMQIVEALEFLKNIGVKSDRGVHKIEKYCKVNSMLALRYALVLNGPCIGALRVYNEYNDFWKRDYVGQEILGGHAIAIVGYDKKGFIIRNSWGTGYGERGYWYLDYDDFGKFLEVWTIID